MGGRHDAVATITHQADAGRFRGTERTGADETAAYLNRKAPHLDYPTALTNGWQIATGIIEGAAFESAEELLPFGVAWGAVFVAGA